MPPSIRLSHSAQGRNKLSWYSPFSNKGTDSDVIEKVGHGLIDNREIHWQISDGGEDIQSDTRKTLWRMCISPSSAQHWQLSCEGKIKYHNQEEKPLSPAVSSANQARHCARRKSIKTAPVLQGRQGIYLYLRGAQWYLTQEVLEGYFHQTS